MKILILGGIGEAWMAAKKLSAQGFDISYSQVKQKCLVAKSMTIRSGGFEGIASLNQYLISNQIELILDISHPYANIISNNAVKSSSETNIPVWQYRRPAWQPTGKDHWVEETGITEVITSIVTFKNPFFTIGASALKYANQIPEHQYWTIRCLTQAHHQQWPRIKILENKGPFQLDDEIRLFKKNNFDVLISKNSGSQSVYAKILAARKMQCPVVMLARPSPPTADKQFDRINDLIESLASIS